MHAVMDNVQYNEHKLAEKAQRILDIKQEMNKLKKEEEQLHAEKPTSQKDKLTYKESIEFGKKVDRYEEELQKIELKTLKLKRQLSALELQAQKLLPVSGVKVKVSKYSNSGQPLQTYCIQQQEDSGHDKSEDHIRVKPL